MELFHNCIHGEDILFVIFDPDAIPDKTEKRGDVYALYKGEELVGYNFFSFHDLVKTKEKGLIVSPNDKLIDVLNFRLGYLGLPLLPYVRNSYFKAAKVVDIKDHPSNSRTKVVTLNLGDGNVTAVTKYANFGVGDMLVILIDKGFRFNGTIFHGGIEKGVRFDAEICSASDLHLGDESNAAFVIDGYEPGDDFFLK